MRPGGLYRVDEAAEADAPIVIEVVKGGVLEWLPSADARVVHEQVDSPDVLDGRRDPRLGTADAVGGHRVLGQRSAGTQSAPGTSTMRWRGLTVFHGRATQGQS